MDLKQIENILQNQGFARFGWTLLQRPLSMAVYESWLSEGLHADMAYLADHKDAKADPQKLLPRAQSALVVAHKYIPHPEPLRPLPHMRIARYAQGIDYHFWLKTKLKKVVEELQQLYPQEGFLIFTDSAPVLERDLAYRAGLGWVGKNTCLIHPKEGSLFLLGEIYTTLSLTDQTPAPLVHDHCGTCTRCLDICPTQALVEPRKLDARKCISYWTIESRTPAPAELREKFADWMFGCDLCQTVCPWNLKWHKEELKEETPSLDDLVQDLRFLLTSSNSQIEKTFRGTPLLRAGPWGLKRNALIVVGNLKIKELQAEALSLLEQPRLADVAQWCLSRF